MSQHHADHRRLPWRQWARVRRAALDRDGWRLRPDDADPDGLEAPRSTA